MISHLWMLKRKHPDEYIIHRIGPPWNSTTGNIDCCHHSLIKALQLNLTLLWFSLWFQVIAIFFRIDINPSYHTCLRLGKLSLIISRAFLIAHKSYKLSFLIKRKTNRSVLIICKGSSENSPRRVGRAPRLHDLRRPGLPSSLDDCSISN